MSQARNYKRSLARATKNPNQAAIMNRYFSKVTEFKALPFEELDTLAKDIMDKKIKMSSTDREAFYDVYRPLIFEKAMKQASEKMSKPKEEINQIEDIQHEDIKAGSETKEETT